MGARTQKARDFKIKIKEATDWAKLSPEPVGPSWVLGTTVRMITATMAVMPASHQNTMRQPIA